MPINRIPLEILGVIFDFHMENISPMLFPPRTADVIELWMTNFPFRFHLVCRHWYEVALSIPSLWSHIYSRTFRVPPSLTMDRCPPPAPLHLNIVFRTGSVGWDVHWERLVSLHMILKQPLHQPSDLLEMMRPAPLLESLSIEDLVIWNHQNWSHPWFGLKQYCNLRRLTLDCSNLPRQELEEIPGLTKLTHLFLQKIKAEDIFPILSGFIDSSFLEVLILEANCDEAAHDFSDAPIVCLPVLRHLETRYIPHLIFIEHLAIPLTTTIITTIQSTEEAPLPQERLDTVQTLDVKFTQRNPMSLCFLSDTSGMVESQRRRNVLLPLLSTWFPNVTTLDLRLLHNSANGDSEERLMYGIVGWTGLRRLVCNELVDYFRLIDILNMSGIRSSDLDLDGDELVKTLNKMAPICPLLQEVVVWEVPADFESEYEGVEGRWKYREPGRYEIVRPQPALAYTLVVRAQTYGSGIPSRPSFKWTETDRY